MKRVDYWSLRSFAVSLVKDWVCIQTFGSLTGRHTCNSWVSLCHCSLHATRKHCWRFSSRDKATLADQFVSLLIWNYSQLLINQSKRVCAEKGEHRWSQIICKAKLQFEEFGTAWRLETMQLFLWSNPNSTITSYVTNGKTYRALHDMALDFMYNLVPYLIPLCSHNFNYKVIFAHLWSGQACSNLRVFAHAALV